MTKNYFLLFNTELDSFMYKTVIQYERTYYNFDNNYRSNITFNNITFNTPAVFNLEHIKTVIDLIKHNRYNKIQLSTSTTPYKQITNLCKKYMDTILIVSSDYDFINSIKFSEYYEKV